MPTAAITCFRQLKEDIAQTARKACPGNPEDIQTWKGEQIHCFQEDLIRQVNGRISEKWFYTHIKANQETLPRIDMLNLLSRYVGYEGWDDYQHHHSAGVSETASPSGSTRTTPLWYVVAALLLVASVAGFYRWSQPSTPYQFCFVNAYSKQPVSAGEIEVMVLSEGESPYRWPVNPEGCLTVDTRRTQVRLVIRSSYYKNDTIVRRLDKANTAEQIALETDDYAWMIRLFSQAEVSDWQRRRAQLDTMISSDARIYQLLSDQTVGMEVYNKQEFINKLTMPLRSLRHIEILDIRYQGSQIKVLRFKQKNDGSKP